MSSFCTQKGVCVDCIQTEQMCQKDNQCCEGLQCDKGSDLATNGHCRPHKAEGEACVSDTQCESHDCSDRWYSAGGVCQP